MKRRTCFLVCNAHLDPVWLWPWEDGMVEAISTFRVAAEFCENHPDFVFNHNETLLYEWVERNDPELFARIRKLVKKGKWNPAGGSFLQPDLVAASGESLIRQYLLGKRYFAAKFGVEPRTAYNFDSFGHPVGLIQILAGCGFDSYVFCRPGTTQCALPIGIFRWRHPSGAEILARRSDDHYLTQGHIRRQMRDGAFPQHYATEGDFLYLWGIGNHGGGPSREEYAQLRELCADYPEIDFVESTPEAFFRHALATRDLRRFPVVERDLKPCYEGCYTSMLRVKQQHRSMENLMRLTETLAAMAWWRRQRDYPADDLRVAWKDVLFSEFHDILPGSGVPSVESDSLKLLGHCEEILRRKKAETVIAMLRDEPLAERNAAPFFVFNPHSWPVAQTVEIEYCLDRQCAPGAVLRTLSRDGESVPAQWEKPEDNTMASPSAGEWRARAVFEANVPALSCVRYDASYDLLPAAGARPWRTPALPRGLSMRFTAGRLDIRVNRRTGCLDGLSVDGQRIFHAGTGRPMIFDDVCNSWATRPEWRKPAALFRLATAEQAARIAGSADTRAVAGARKPPIAVIEDGPLRIVVEVFFVHAHSYIVQRYRIFRRQPLLQIDQTIFWAEHDRMLKLSIPHRDDLTRLEAEQCYCIAEESRSGLPEGHERDFQHFLRLSRADNSLAFGLVSHGTHAYNRRPGELRLSILRSPAYACFGFAQRNDRFHDRYIPRQDQGIRENRFTFVFGERSQNAAAMARTALEHNVPLDTFLFFPTRRRRVRAAPPRRPFVAVHAGNVLLSALKRAETGNALVLRFWETAGRTTNFAFTVDGRRYVGRVGRHALQTYLLTPNGKLTPVDLLERPLPRAARTTPRKRR